LSNLEKIGEFLVRIDAMSQKQCDEVFKLQQNGDKRLFGEIAIELGYVDKEAIKQYFHLDK
jgi:hypothetical protein